MKIIIVSSQGIFYANRVDDGLSLEKPYYAMILGAKEPEFYYY